MQEFMQVMDTPVQEAPVENIVPQTTDEQIPVEQPVTDVQAAPEVAAPVSNEKTPEQIEIERLRSEINRLSVDHEVAGFELKLKQSTDAYLANKNKSVEDAHKRNRELIDAGEPEKADQELRSFYARLEAADNSMRQYVQTERTNFTQQREHVTLAPKYAQHLGQVHGLSPEDVALLSKFDGFVQDKMINDIVARNNATKSTEARLRDLEASARAQSGVFAPSGTTGSAAPPQSQRPTDPTQAELYDYMQSPVISSGGR
jgi:hypothetical protein